MRISAYVLLFTTFLYANVFSQGINDLIPKNEAFFIQSYQEYNKGNKGYWDIPGGEDKIKEGADIQVYELGDRAKDRRYIIENSPKAGFVRIHIDGVAGYIDIKSKKNSNGQNIHIWGPNNDWNQNFSFKYLGNGRFKIYNEKGKVLCLSGRNSANKTNVCIWDDHDGPWMEWVLISTRTNQPLLLEQKLNEMKTGSFTNMSGLKTFYIQSALCYGKDLLGYFDVPGYNTTKPGSNLSLWAFDMGVDRKYNLNNSNSNLKYYNICIAGNPNVVVDIAGGVNANGTNIQLWDRNNSSAQNFNFKHLGNGRFKIYAENGKVVCTGREATNGANIHIWDDHDGPWMEWYLIDAETNKPFIPETKQFVNNNSDPVVVGLINDIEKTYSNVSNTEETSSQTLRKLYKSNRTAGNGSSIAQNVSDINSRVNDTQSALNPFSRFPIIGTPVKVLSTTLGLSLGQIGKADKVLQTIKEPVLDKTSENVGYALTSNILVNNKLNYLKTYLQDKKQYLASSEECKNPSVRDAIITKIKNELVEIDNFSQYATGKFNSIQTECNKINKLDKAFDKFDDGLNKFDNGFKKVDKIADEINNVLDKRFKKEIGKVKINISVRDVLEGGKVGKLFDKYVNEFVKNAFKPLMNKLNEKLPLFPEADELKDSFNSTLDITKKIRSESEGIEKDSNKLDVSRN